MRTLRLYRHYLGVLFDHGERWKLVVAVLGSVGIALTDTASVLVVGPLVIAMGTDWRSGSAGMLASALSADSQQELVSVLLGLTVGGFIIKDLLAIYYSWWSSQFTASTKAEAQIAMTEYYMRLPYHLHAHLGLGLIIRKTGQTANQAYSTFAGGILSLASQVFSVICIGVALLIAAPAVTSTMIVLVGGASWLFLRTVKPINERIGREGLKYSQESYEATFDAFGAIRETQLRHSYAFFLDAIATPTRLGARLNRTSAFLNALPKQLMEILFMAGLAIAFIVASLLGSTTNFLASLAMLVAGAFRLLPTFAGAMASLTSIRQGAPGAREFVEDKVAANEAWTSASAPQSTPVNNDHPPLPFRADLALKGVHFSYASDSPEVLRGVSMSIPAGSTAAFVGSSGAGKSTLLDVIMGLQTPTFGTLLVDGIDVQTDLVGWQRNIGVVPQEVFLTDRTIAENVAFDCAREDIDEALVRDSLQKADILDFVETQPEGIWSSFGERGRRLSGGQRQRIGIARALYRQPSVLILDEATSALDNESEARIAETIATLHGQITVIIVAHRLSTVRDADMIAYLENGRVEATGKFSELQERSEGFRHLVELASLDEKR